MQQPTIARIRVLVVDDEPLARSNLTVLLRRDAAVEKVQECGSGAEAIEEIRNSKPDLVFLDVQMPECDGFDVLEMLGRDLPPAVVFVTAYDHYALRAFEAGALDYLLKPFDNARFGRALARAELEKELDPVIFCRVHRSTIVNLSRVRGLKLSEDGEYDVALDSGATLRLSRRYRKPLQERLGLREAHLGAGNR